MLFSHVRTSSWFDLLLFTNWIELFEKGYICLPFYAKSWQNYSRNLLDCMWVGILSHFPDFLIILISIIITNVFTIVLSCQSRLPFFFFLLAFITFLFFFLSFFLFFFFFFLDKSSLLFSFFLPTFILWQFFPCDHLVVLTSCFEFLTSTFNFGDKETEEKGWIVNVVKETKMLDSIV